MSKKHIIVNFIIQKLKNKHIFLKKYTDWANLGHVTQNLELDFSAENVPLRQEPSVIPLVELIPLWQDHTGLSLDYFNYT